MVFYRLRLASLKIDNEITWGHDINKISHRNQFEINTASLIAMKSNINDGNNEEKSLVIFPISKIRKRNVNEPKHWSISSNEMKI